MNIQNWKILSAACFLAAFFSVSVFANQTCTVALFEKESKHSRSIPGIALAAEAITYSGPEGGIDATSELLYIKDNGTAVQGFYVIGPGSFSAEFALVEITRRPDGRIVVGDQIRYLSENKQTIFYNDGNHLFPAPIEEHQNKPTQVVMDDYVVTVSCFPIDGPY